MSGNWDIRPFIQKRRVVAVSIVVDGNLDYIFRGVVKKLPKIDTLDAQGDEMTSILKTL